MGWCFFSGLWLEKTHDGTQVLVLSREPLDRFLIHGYQLVAPFQMPSECMVTYGQILNKRG